MSGASTPCLLCGHEPPSPPPPRPRPLSVAELWPDDEVAQEALRRDRETAHWQAQAVRRDAGPLPF